MADDQQIEGLPEGATVRPIQQPQATATDATQVEGLPAGATVRPVASAKPPVAPAAPKATPSVEDTVTSALDPTQRGMYEMAKGAVKGARGLYHGVMGDQETQESKGTPSGTVASPQNPAGVAHYGFDPEHLGHAVGELGRGVAGFVGGAAKDIVSSKTPVIVPNEKGVSIGDPAAKTLVGKYIAAPSEEERQKAIQEFEQYYNTHGWEATGHALAGVIHDLGESVPMVGPFAAQLIDKARNGDIGGALAQVAALKAGEKAQHAVTGELKSRVSNATNAATETPEVKQTKANVDALAKELAKKQELYNTAKAAHDQYAASHAQGIAAPKNVTNALTKASEELAEAQFHHESAVDHAQKVQAAQPTIPQRVGSAVGKTVAKVLPAQQPAEIPTEEVEAKPVLSRTGQVKPTSTSSPDTEWVEGKEGSWQEVLKEPTLRKLGQPKPPINVKTPGQVQPETFPQEPKEAPRVGYGRIALANNQGTVGKPLQLGEGTPEGPQIPKGGLPKIKQTEVLPPEKPAVKPERGNVKALTVDEKGNIIDKEATPEMRLQKLIEEGLKRNTDKKAPVVEAPKTEEPIEKRTEDRRKEEVPVEQERRQGDRRNAAGIRVDENGDPVMSPDLQGHWQSAAFGEKPAEDIGAKARAANPEPTRAETEGKPTLPAEDNKEYTPKKEEVVPAGEEGREQPTSAGEYHPVVQEQVTNLSDDNLRKLAKAHGLNPDEYDFKKRDEGRHRVERDYLVNDIMSQLGDDEKINLGRSAGNLEHNAAMANKAKADRAASIFPRLRGPVDEYGNPKVSGGSQAADKESKNQRTMFFDPDNLTVKPHELENAQLRMRESGKTPREWALEQKDKNPEPIQVSHKNGTYTVEDGHHRYLAAKILGDALKADVRDTEVKRNAKGSPVDEYGNPAVSGGSQSADEEAERLKNHVAETSSKDTDHVQAAMKELGPDAKLSDIMDRAQKMKTEAAKSVDLKSIAAEHNKAEGRGEITTEKVDKDPKAAEFSKAYDKMKHDPSNPEVKKTYDALVDDTKKQWDRLQKAGIKIEPTDEDPYKSYEEMRDDIKNNKTLKVFRGGNPLPEDHPLAKVDPQTGETYNVMFRAVHDAFGHAMNDNDFTEKGEENAYNTHKQMMSKEAIPAMTTETKAQVSSFFNNGEKFPDQKAGILPDIEEKGKFKPTNRHAEDLAYEHKPEGIDNSNQQHRVTTTDGNGKKIGEVVAQDTAAGEVTVRSDQVYDKNLRGAGRGYDQMKHFLDRVAEDKNIHTVHSDISNSVPERSMWEKLMKDYPEAITKREFKDGQTQYTVDTEKYAKAQVPSVSGGSPSPFKTRLAEKLVKKYGTTDDPSKAGFILPDGRMVKLSGEHDQMVTSVANKGELDDMPYGSGPRETIIANEGVVRIRSRETRAGKETVFSIPDKISDDQAEQIKQAVAKQGRYGNVVVEQGKPGGDFRKGEFATPTTVQKMLEELGAVPKEDVVGDAKRRYDAAMAAKGAEPEVSVQRSKGFSELNGGDSGVYDVKVGPLKTQMYRSPDDGNWYEANTGKHFSEAYLGFNKADALDTLKKRAENMPKVNEKGSPVDQFGNPTVSGGSQGAVPGKAKAGALPRIAEENLTEEEKAGVTKTDAGRKTFVDNLKKLPSVQEFTDIAKAGEGGRKWYQRSAKAFDALVEEAPKYFQDGDRQKFTDFLAALSPQQSVKMNLGEALNAWTRYVDEGRPTGKPLEKMLKDELTLPGAKIPNATKALAGEPLWPDLSKNSNFKVPSFAKNLNGYLNHVTNDGWQAMFGGLEAKQISKANSYHPLAVVTREAAKALGWEPAEAQAAIWAFTKTFTEKGETHPEDIRRRSEDFADILALDPEIRQQLKQLGVNHEQLDAKLRAIGKKPPVTPGASPTTENSVGKLAKRIEGARGKGTIPAPKSGSLNFGDDEDEEIGFNPKDFESETSGGLEKLGKKKSPFGRIK